MQTDKLTTTDPLFMQLSNKKHENKSLCVVNGAGENRASVVTSVLAVNTICISFYNNLCIWDGGLWLYLEWLQCVQQSSPFYSAS